MSVRQTIRILWLTLMAGMLWLPASFILAQTPVPTTPPAGLTIHVVQRDETLFRIALNYGTSVDNLAAINGIIDTGSIQVGQRLLVPSGDAVTPEPQSHVVQPGENLTGIAGLYNVTANDLMVVNNIASPNQLYPGQVVQIGKAPAGVSGTITPAPAASATPAVSTSASVSDVPLVGSNLHTVASGETLFRIATAYHLSVNDLATANGIADPTLIYVGQQLIIPGTSTEPTALNLPAPFTSLSVKPLMFMEGETGSIQVVTSSPSDVTVTFLDKDLRVIAEDGNTRHSMMIGIPVFTEAGIYPVTITAGTSSYTFNLRMVSGGYGSQNITVSADLAPLLAPAAQDYELELLVRTTTPFTEPRYFTGVFGLPAAAPMNSPFGTRRSYNGGTANLYHSGADFASAPGMPVFAAAPGKVVLADLLNIRGNTVVIDHGWGIYSVYCHMSEVNAQLEQIVEAGQIIGAAGSTGRITGPHLHWEVWVNGVAVNPLQWLTEVFP